jgi:hypothetical protein
VVSCRIAHSSRGIDVLQYLEVLYQYHTYQTCNKNENVHSEVRGVFLSPPHRRTSIGEPPILVLYCWTPPSEYFNKGLHYCSGHHLGSHRVSFGSLKKSTLKLKNTPHTHGYGLKEFKMINFFKYCLLIMKLWNINNVPPMRPLEGYLVIWLKGRVLMKQD